MSDSVIKGERKASARTSASSQSAIPAANNRKQAGNTTRPAKLAPRSSPTAKRPAQKAAKPSVSASSKAKTAAKERAKPTKPAKATTARTQAKPQTALASRALTHSGAASRSKAKKVKAPVAQAAKATSKKQVVSTKQVKQGAKSPVAPSKAIARTAKSPVKSAHVKSARGKQSGVAVPTPFSPPAAIVRGKTRDDAAALEDFRRAHQQFARGRFAEAATSFRSIIERFPGVAEVTARSRTYVAVAEARLRTQKSQPISDDAIYDRGVVELNRANYTAAQEMFERALGQDERAAHVHYGLAAVRARLGSRPSALESLERAIELQPSLRVRASQDADLASLRGEAEFERIVFSSR